MCGIFFRFYFISLVLFRISVVFFSSFFFVRSQCAASSVLSRMRNEDRVMQPDDLDRNDLMIHFINIMYVRIGSLLLSFADDILLRKF